MKIIELTDVKKTEISEGLEEILRIGGRLMSCIDELEPEEGHMGMRRGGRMGYRDNGSAMGYRGRGGYRANEMHPMGRGGYMSYEDPYYE